MVMEELQLLNKRGRVRALNKLELKGSEELHESKLQKQVLQRGLLLEFKKDTERVVIAVAQKPDGKKNWMVSDQNGVMTSIKRQQITFIVPGVENFDHVEISNFVLKAQHNLIRYYCISHLSGGGSLVCIFYNMLHFLFQDPSLLEFAWIELLEKNKFVTVEELADMIFGCAEPLESYCSHLLLSTDDIYFTAVETKGSASVYGPKPIVQVEELMGRKHTKEAAEKELAEFVNSLKFAKNMPLNAKPPKSTWISKERVRKKIEPLQAYNDFNFFQISCSIAEYSVENSIIKPAYVLTYESATELLHLNLEEEVGLQVSGWVLVGVQVGDEIKVEVEEAHPRNDVIILKEVQGIS